MPFPDHCLHLRFCLHVFSFHYIAYTSATTAKTAYKDDNIVQKLKIFVKPQNEIARQKCRYGMQKLKSTKASKCLQMGLRNLRLK